MEMATTKPKSGKSTFANKELAALTKDNDGETLKESNGISGAVRLKADGSLSVDWSWRYRFGGKVKELRLGAWPKIAMPKIRAERDDAAQLLKEGKDPAEERRAAKLKAQADQIEAVAKEKTRIIEGEASAARLTIKGLFTRWQELDLSRRKDKGAETTRVFNKDVLPVIGGMYADEVKRAQIAALLDTVVARGARIVARNLLGDIRQMFGFAIRRGLLENDPTSHMKRDDYGTKVERARVLSEAEVRALPELIDQAGMFLTSAHAIWIMLATCCRVGELSQAAWADVDLEAKQWRIPPENSKNAKEHVIDLSDFAIRHFEAIKTVTGTKINDDGEVVAGEWVLVAKHNDGPVCVKSLAKQIGDRQREAAPMKNRTPLIDALKLPGGKWTPHDLRRTGATMMGALGVQSEVIERCLNHTEQNALKRIYQRHDYRAEMSAAWLLLGERLDLLTRADASNVLMMKRAA
jgi:integrase